MIVSRGDRVWKLEFGEAKPVVRFKFKEQQRFSSENKLEILGETLEFRATHEGCVFFKPLGLREHILGLGEKAYPIERKRTRCVMWNTDSYGYGWESDPLYVSIPFFISVNKDAKGFFVNSCSKLTFDIGVGEYDRIVVSSPEDWMEVYIFEGPRISDVVERFCELVGKPFLPPKWFFGHQISRYSYFPQNTVLELVEEHKKEGIPVDVLYLDIDYMDGYRLFTWDKSRFPDPKSLVQKLHQMGVKVVTILDPGIKLDQNYEVFKKFLGFYVENCDSTIYTGRVWPGMCVFPDFFNPKARELWSKTVEEWVREYDLDGVWLDMNEPSVFNESKSFSEDAVHTLGNGKKVSHVFVHNAYALYEAMATFEGVKRVKEGFVLTRSGYAGIQRFAAVWSGDNTSSWENMRLQLPLLLSLSLSGVPFVGCDVGGFIGRSDPELVARFYEMCCLLPLFRNHKDKKANDQEAYNLPSRYKEMVKRAISLRLSLLPYIYSLAYQASKRGHPVIRPLAYEFQDDENCYQINDEYMLGPSLLVAPILEKGAQKREVYLPRGTWLDWWTEDEQQGEAWVTATQELPLFLRKGSILPTEQKIVVYGSSSFLLYQDKEVELRSEENALYSSQPLEASVEFKKANAKRAKVDENVVGCENGKIEKVRFTRIILL